MTLEPYKKLGHKKRHQGMDGVLCQNRNKLVFNRSFWVNNPNIPYLWLYVKYFLKGYFLEFVIKVIVDGICIGLGWTINL